jgi:hypothetical protein
MFSIKLIKELIKLDEDLGNKYKEIAKKFDNPEQSNSETIMCTIIYQRYILKDEDLRTKYNDLLESIAEASTEQSDEEAPYNFQGIDFNRIRGEQQITSLDDVDFRFYTSGRMARVGDVYYKMLLGTTDRNLVPIIVHKNELNKLYIIYNMGEKNFYYESKNGMTIVQTLHNEVDDSTEGDNLFYNWN